MSDCFAKQDIYDKNGKLLLGKGQKITNETRKKLQRHGAFFPKIEEPVRNPIVQTFAARKNIRNARITKLPYKILTAITFESKDKPWWIYVNALSNYAEEIYTHSIDVAIISLMVAVELGYSEKEQWNLGRGAFFHDVGKLLVPESIVQKSEPLTELENFSIRQHCELGVSSLKPFDFPLQSTDIVLQHHEHLDGSGYPKGLKGNEISKNAQIVMVADTLDRLSSPRPYRRAQTISEAINILKSEKEKYPQELVLLMEKVLGL